MKNTDSNKDMMMGHSSLCNVSGISEGSTGISILPICFSGSLKGTHIKKTC